VVEEEKKNTMREASLKAATRKYAPQIRGSDCSGRYTPEPATNPAVKPVLPQSSGRSHRGSFTDCFICLEERKVTPT